MLGKIKVLFSKQSYKNSCKVKLDGLFEQSTPRIAVGPLPELYVTRHKLQKKTVRCTINCVPFTTQACTVASFYTKIRPRVRSPLNKFMLL